MSTEEVKDSRSVEYSGRRTKDGAAVLTMKIGDSISVAVAFRVDDEANTSDMDFMIENFAQIFDSGLAEFTTRELAKAKEAGVIHA